MEIKGKMEKCDHGMRGWNEDACKYGDGGRRLKNTAHEQKKRAKGSQM